VKRGSGLTLVGLPAPPVAISLAKLRVPFGLIEEMMIVLAALLVIKYVAPRDADLPQDFELIALDVLSQWFVRTTGAAIMLTEKNNAMKKFERNILDISLNNAYSIETDLYIYFLNLTTSSPGRRDTCPPANSKSILLQFPLEEVDLDLRRPMQVTKFQILSLRRARTR